MDPLVTEAELEAIHCTFHRLEQRWNVLPIPDAGTWHAYDPLPIALFLPGIRAATGATEGRRFLDLGCGMGTKLALMYALGFEVAGVERHAPYAEAARELVPEANVTVADIFDLDRFDADLIFIYRPAKGDEMEDALERHVVDRLAAGTVLFLPCRTPPETRRLRPVAHEVWEVV